MYKVFSTLIKDKEVLGESILCKDFDSLEDAKTAGENQLIFPGCFYTIREYDNRSINIIGGDSDTGKEVYASNEEVYASNKEEVKELKLLEFNVNPELSQFTDSMLFDSHGDEIAFSKWSYDGTEFRICLEVNGEVAVTYKNVTYHTPSEFPEELKEMIRTQRDWYTNEDVYANFNNWFEYLWRESVFADSDIEGSDISKMDGKDILNTMENIVKKYFKVPEIIPIYPEYKLEGYDKDNDAWLLLGMYLTKEEAVRDANACRPYLKEDKIKRYCSDGTFEPIDWLEVSDKNCYVWKSYIADWNEAHPVDELDYMPSKVMAPDYSGMSYNEMQRAMMSDNID